MTTLSFNQDRYKPRIIIFSPDTPEYKEAIRKASISTKPENPPRKSPEVRPPGEIPKNDDYIFVPELKLWIAKQRTHLNKTWEDTHKILETEQSFMPTIPIFIGFVNYLQDPNGYSNREEAEQILDDILTKRNPWRAEHLDAYFEISDSGKYILTKNKTQRAKLESCLMKDCKADIFGSPNSQGLPTKEGSEFNFWYPRDECVARFVADADGVDLRCGGGSSSGDPALGVRPCKTLEGFARLGGNN